MRRLKSGRGRSGATCFGERGARGRASHARSREAPHSRPPARRPAAPALGLHAAEMKGGGSRSGSGPQWGAASPPGRAAEGAQNRRTWSAGWRARRSQGALPPIRRQTSVAHPALHPLALFCGGDSPRPPVERGNRDDGVPGAAKNTGDAARLPRSRSSQRKRAPSCESVLDSRFRGNERRLWRALEALSRPPLPW